MSTGVIFILGKGGIPILASGVKSTWPQGSSAPGFSNLDLIRADEVWFVEKDKDGASKLVSLAEYKPRENVQKGYFQGRYGAIPIFGELNK